MRWVIINKSNQHIENIVNWDGNGTFDLPATHEMRQFVDGDVVWSEPEPAMPDLSSARFRYMLAYAGLNTVMDGLVQYLQDNNHPLFAAVYGHLSGQIFEYDKTLSIVAQLRPISDSLYPTADTSDAAITAAWQEALDWEA